MKSSTYVLGHAVHGVSARFEQEVIYDHVGYQLVDPRLLRRLVGGRAHVPGEDRHHVRIQLSHEYLQSLIRLWRILRLVAYQSVQIPTVCLG